MAAGERSKGPAATVMQAFQFLKGAELLVLLKIPFPQHPVRGNLNDSGESSRFSICERGVGIGNSIMAYDL